MRFARKRLKKRIKWRFHKPAMLMEAIEPDETENMNHDQQTKERIDRSLGKPPARVGRKKTENYTMTNSQILADSKAIIDNAIEKGWCTKPSHTEARTDSLGSYENHPRFKVPDFTGGESRY